MSSRRRMSLGGGALRRNVLAEHSSTANVISNSQRFTLSIQEDCGTPQKSIELDGSTYGSASSKRRSSSVPRRQSFGGNSLLSHGIAANQSSAETPIRDRRAMLEAWRRARGGDGASVGAGDPSSVETRKRTRGDPPLLPPSSKQHRTTLSQDRTSLSGTQSLYQPHHPSDINSQASLRSTHTIDYYDQDAENRGAFTAHTPSSRQGTIGSARRKSLMGRSIYHLNEGKKMEDRNIHLV
jgi:hypothetical protein